MLSLTVHWLQAFERERREMKATRYAGESEPEYPDPGEEHFAEFEARS